MQPEMVGNHAPDGLAARQLTKATACHCQAPLVQTSAVLAPVLLATSWTLHRPAASSLGRVTYSHGHDLAILLTSAFFGLLLAALATATAEITPSPFCAVPCSASTRSRASAAVKRCSLTSITLLPLRMSPLRAGMEERVHLIVANVLVASEPGGSEEL